MTITPIAPRTCAAGSVVPTTAGSMTLATPVTLPANSGPTALTVPGAVTMIATAEDGCQGASFSTPITVIAVRPAPSPPAPARAASTTITAIQTPTATSRVRVGGLYAEYTVTWTSVPMANGMPVTGYLVSEAMVSGGGTLLSGGSCAGSPSLLGLGTARAVPSAVGVPQTCTEQALVAAGTPKYQVTPVYGHHWRGTPSAWATPTA